MKGVRGWTAKGTQALEVSNSLYRVRDGRSAHQVTCRSRRLRWMRTASSSCACAADRRRSSGCAVGSPLAWRTGSSWARSRRCRRRPQAVTERRNYKYHAVNCLSVKAEVPLVRDVKVCSLVRDFKDCPLSKVLRFDLLSKISRFLPCPQFQGLSSCSRFQGLFRK